MEQKYLVALEVGSSKIRGALGILDNTGVLTVKAVEEERLIDSVRHGCVRNVSEVAEGARAVLRRLEAREGGRRITGVYVALGGRSTVSSPCRVQRCLSTETVINRDHLHQIFEEARATVLNDRDVVEAVPAEFFIDNQRSSKPEGAIGREIEAIFNLVSTRRQLKRNLSHALEKSLGLNVCGYVVRQLAEAALVLTPEEQRLGCMLVDFGAETTTVAIYKDGYLGYLATLPMGSRNITRDIMSLNHLEEKAEHLKIVGGDAAARRDNLNPYDGIDYTQINEMVSARAGEIIANIREQLHIADVQASDLPAGIIIVGGGAKLRGFNPRLAEATGMSVRSGQPSSAIRILDSRIQPGDAVDVIALLHAVAAKGTNCLDTSDEERYVQSQLPIDNEPESPRVGTIGTIGDSEPDPEAEAEAERRRKEREAERRRKEEERDRKRAVRRDKTRSFVDRWRKKFSSAFSENEDDNRESDDDEMRDDDDMK